MDCLELFSGAGGLAAGLEKCGLSHQGFVEFNKHACQTLRHNFSPKQVHETDIRTFDFSQFSNVDFVAGGPPCQPFSMGGKHQGSLDSRDMFPQACRAIASCQPKAFIFENVKGLLRQSFRSYFDYIILRLSFPELTQKQDELWEHHKERLEVHQKASSHLDLHYNVAFKLIDAANYGIPQRRERVFIVGIRSDLNTTWSPPIETHSLDALLWEQYSTNSYWDRHQCKSPDLESYDPQMRELIKRTLSSGSWFPPNSKPWKTIRDQLGKLPPPDDEGSFHQEHILRNGAKSYPGHTGSFYDLPSKTIKAGGHGVPGGENMIRFADGSLRYFTTFEAKLIQTFDPSYQILGSWTESMRQIGNAVPVKLAQAITQSVLDSTGIKISNQVAIKSMSLK